MFMFFGCTNLCLGVSFIEVNSDEKVSLTTGKRSFIKITDKNCSKKLPIATDKNGLADIIIQINKYLKTIMASNYQLRIFNPDEKPIRNDKYIRYVLQVYDAQFISTLFYELYLIISTDGEDETIFYIKTSNNLSQVNVPDWNLLENVFRSLDYNVKLENPIVSRPKDINSMK